MADALIEWLHAAVSVQLGREQDALEHAVEAALILGVGVRVDQRPDGGIAQVTLTPDVPAQEVHWHRP